MRIFAVTHNLIETYFDDLVSTEFRQINTQKTVASIYYTFSVKWRYVSPPLICVVPSAPTLSIDTEDKQI